MVAKFHLFDTKAYPLFTLVNDIVTKPESLKNKVDGYLLQLRVW
jgi:hypothetical protein